ncbi:MAG: outer membrane beta-barrel protein [Bacteroidota bacterium]
MRALLLLVSLLLLIPQASAQRKGALSLSVGYSEYGVEGYACNPNPSTAGACFSRGSSSVRTSRYRRGEGGGGFVALRIRGNMSEQISGELSVFTHWATETAGGRMPPIQPTATSAQNGNREDTWASGIDVAAEYALLDGTLRPTVALGAGLITFGTDGSLDVQNVGISPTVLAGVGVEQKLGSGLLFRVDGRLRHAFDGGETLARAAELSAGVGVIF